MSKHSLLYIIICVFFLSACADRQVEAVLDAAQALFDSEEYAAADSLLQTIDAPQLKPGSRQQARYALLYTKTQYKQYIDAPNDSLISLCVDYAEDDGDAEDRFYAYLYQGIVRYELGDFQNSIQSLLRSMEYSNVVSDPYSKGQMYSILALLNGETHCSEENYYALKAFGEFGQGDLRAYQMNAMSKRAVAKLRSEEYDSCLLLIDSCINYSRDSSSQESFCELISIKAQLMMLLDRFDEAESLYEVIQSTDYCLSVQDYTNLALSAAYSSDASLANLYLCRASSLLLTPNDTIQYWIKASRVGRLLNDSSLIIIGQDSLLRYQDGFLKQALVNATNAVQRDYSKWQLEKLSYISDIRYLELISSSVCFLLFLCAIVLKRRKDITQIRLQSEIIEKLQAQIAQQSAEISINYKQLLDCDTLKELRKISKNEEPHHIEWDSISTLFKEKIPYFETSLIQLTKRVCQKV